MSINFANGDCRLPDLVGLRWTEFLHDDDVRPALLAVCSTRRYVGFRFCWKNRWYVFSGMKECFDRHQLVIFKVAPDKRPPNAHQDLAVIGK